MLSERMLDAIKREKLKPKDIPAHRQRGRRDRPDASSARQEPDRSVPDLLPRPGRPKWESGVGGVSSRALFKFITTDYGKFRFWKRVMAARWQALETRLRRMPAPADPDREKVAHEHVKAFFGGLVGYAALRLAQTQTQTPKTKPTPQPQPTPKPKQKKEADEADIAGEAEDVIHRSNRPPGGGGGGAPARGGAVAGTSLGGRHRSISLRA